MPVHNQCNEIKNITEHLSALTHAAKAMAHETHCWCTRYVPRRVPRLCPCIADFNKMKYMNRDLSPFSHATKATTHGVYTRHVPRCVHRPCPCTTDFNKIRYITENLSAFTHATEATTHAAFTRHVPRRVPRSCLCTADFNKMKYVNRKFISILTCNKGHDTRGVH